MSFWLLLVFSGAYSIKTSTMWGAIRWDAFVNSSSTGQQSGVGEEVARVLQPNEWHDRLPWYSTFLQDGNVTFDGSSPGVMEAEIEMAVKAGIDHWVFDVYPEGSDLSAALHAYINATSGVPADTTLSFALLLQGAYGQSLPWSQVPIYATHFARPQYRLVLGNRPLVHLFGPSAVDFNLKGWQGWGQALTELAAASLLAGRGQPYVVFLSASPSTGLSALKAINLAAPASPPLPYPLVAALSSYYLPGATPSPGTPFAQFSQGGIEFWDELAALGVDVIPPLAAGWDNRPRNATPVPWEPWVGDDYVVMPTPGELADFVQAAIDWDARHKSVNPARCFLLSAWNEYDEGHYVGAVLPQFGGNARLEAIGKVLTRPRLF